MLERHRVTTPGKIDHGPVEIYERREYIPNTPFRLYIGPGNWMEYYFYKLVSIYSASNDLIIYPFSLHNAGVDQRKDMYQISSSILRMGL